MYVIKNQYVSLMFMNAGVRCGRLCCKNTVGVSDIFINFMQLAQAPDIFMNGIKNRCVADIFMNVMNMQRLYNMIMSVIKMQMSVILVNIPNKYRTHFDRFINLMKDIMHVEILGCILQLKVWARLFKASLA